ncbi:MAG: histidine kinase [Chitinophagales bacterium]|nr:histidine kinase [Chitinophagales bacterium]
MQKRYFIIFFLVSLVSFSAGAGEPFTKDIWLNESAIPVKVNCLVKDESGYIWLGTDEGLYRYNGRNFTNIQLIAGQAVTALACYDSRLVVGFAKGGLGIWDGEKYYAKKLSGNKPGDAISSIYVVSGNVWVVSTLGEGLYLVYDNYCTRYTMDDGLADDYVYTILSPSQKLLLAATDQGINEIKNESGKFEIQHFNTSTGLPDNIVRVIRPMAEKCWSWIGTHQGGVALYCSKDRRTWTPRTNLTWQWGQINDILPVGDNKAWVCTENGYILRLMLHGEDSLAIEPFAYQGKKIYRMLMGQTGNIWCATNEGVMLIISEYMTSVKLPVPYSVQDLSAIACDNDNILWFAQKNKLYNFSLAASSPKIKESFVSNTPITNLYFGPKGALWVGTFGDGLWLSKDHRHFTKMNGISPLQNESILDIKGKGNNLWVAGLNGVEELKVEQEDRLSLVKVHNKTSGIGSDYVYNMLPDENNNIWMATDGAGVCRYNNGVYTHWDSTSGMNSSVIYNITEDASGDMWTSTFDKGLLVYTGKKWKSIDKEDGLQSLMIATIAPTVNKAILVVHAKGIDEWQQSGGQFRHYERRLGVGIDTVSAALNLYASDTAGNVYIPYQDGMVCFGKHNYTVKITPSVYIRSLKTFFRETRLQRYSFKHSENHITFSYDGINFANPEQLYYRYKLEGYNEDWITTRDESVTFPQLSSGDYRFVIQVSLNSKFNTFGEATHTFTIEKPYWQEIWFLLLIIGLLWGIAYTYIRIREYNLRKLSSLQKERMMFEYEHLKSQVNPHFLFNSLNTLTGLIEDDTQLAVQYTTQLSDLYRNMLSHKDKDLITLSEEWKILQNYIYIQKSRFGEALQLVVDIPDRLKNKKVVPMSLQLLLENAIKHNIVSQAKPLIVKFVAAENELTISNNYQPKMSKEKGAGLGLANIRKRYALHTKNQVLSRIENHEFIVVIPLI